MKAAIFDLDNCISDDEWRLDRIDLSRKGEERFFTYHTLAAFDQMRNIDKIHAEQAAGHHIILSTGRPVAFKPVVQHWMRYWGVDPHAIFMRNPDHTGLGVVEIKRQALRAIRDIMGVEVVRAYDDRADIIQMYTEEGVEAVHLRIHNKGVY